MFNHYTFVQDAAQERLHDFIKDAERERQVHEFLNAHPEYKTSSKVRAFVRRILHHRLNTDDNQNEIQKLQKNAG